MDPKAVGRAVTATGQSYTDTYGDGAGIEVVNTVVNARVRVGSVTTGPIGVALLASSCGGTPCTGGTSARSLLGGYAGILGIALADEAAPASPVYSPLLQLPGSARDGFTLKLGTRKGSLVAGSVRRRGVPVRLQPATPDRYPNGVPAYQKDVRLCWAVDAHRACGNTDLDIGAPTPVVTPAALPGLPSANGALAAGSRVTISGPGGRVLSRFTASGRHPVAYAALPGGYTDFNSGIEFAMRHRLAFDLRRGLLYVG
jgi:hypothetical protein